MPEALRVEVEEDGAYEADRVVRRLACRHGLTQGEPLIEVEGDLKAELLAIKRSERSLERAREVSLEIEALTAGARLPETDVRPLADRYRSSVRLCPPSRRTRPRSKRRWSS